MKCKYNRGWAGPCDGKAGPSGFCPDHKDVKCKACGKQATCECPIASSLVCGAPLCDDCGPTCPRHTNHVHQIPQEFLDMRDEFWKNMRAHTFELDDYDLIAAAMQYAVNQKQG